MGRQQTNSKKRKPTVSKAPNQFLKYSNLAFQLLGIFGIAVWGGIWLDQRLGFRFPLFTLSFILIALTGVIYQLIKSGNNSDDEEESH